ncbi:MAG: SDR family NAD(P)-dependent oxidoreductase [Spirochaetia bacterium]|jgi:NAD(P)-dependent dehydrogenase (short-subunit alcohol dehydrogenase family)
MKGRTAIITGAARGIGLGTATCLARKGVNIVIADSNGETARASADALARETGVGTLGVTCDVTQRPQVEAAVEETRKRFGGIDILVNNAGICAFVEVIEMSPEVFQRTIDVNLTGAFHCTQIAGKAMIEQGGGGRIVFITSLAVNVTASAQADYAASKAGLHMLMKSFAIALGRHGITCNAVAPGMILTDMTRFHWEQPEPAAFIRTRVPVGRIGTPEDVGNAVALLCADEAAYINGVGIIVDGGHQAVCA